MGLTVDDVTQIQKAIENIFETQGRTIVREEVHKELQPLKGQLTALENDVKELYTMV